MRGRPKRRAHDDLIDLLQEERRRAGASLRAVARIMDVNPSTLTRSVAQRALSEDMAQRVRDLLKVGIPSQPSLRDATREVRADGVAEHSLLILRKLFAIIPEVEGALRSVLGMPATPKRDA